MPSQYKNYISITLNLKFKWCKILRIFNDKAFFFLTAKKPFGQLFNFRIFIKLFIHEVKKKS